MDESYHAFEQFGRLNKRIFLLVELDRHHFHVLVALFKNFHISPFNRVLVDVFVILFRNGFKDNNFLFLQLGKVACMELGLLNMGCIVDVRFGPIAFHVLIWIFVRIGVGLLVRFERDISLYLHLIHVLFTKLLGSTLNILGMLGISFRLLYDKVNLLF